MVEFVVNGDFTQTSPDGGAGTGLDPAFWTITETNDDQVQVNKDRVQFNRNGSDAGGQIEQTVTGVKIGDPVTFSFDYGEAGGGSGGGDASVLVEILDGDGNVIFSQTATTAGTTSSTTFVATTNDYTIRITDTSTGSLGSLDAFVDNVSFDGTMVCFTKGVFIETFSGPRAIEDIEVGDLIVTQGQGLQPVRWIGSRKLGKTTLSRNPRMVPIRITQGALGNGFPKRDLVVSRQHRMTVSSRIVGRMFGVPEVLVPAIKLTEIPGVFVDETIEDVEYFHLMFDRHEIIFAEGAPTESLFTGPEALKSVSEEARREILTIFPDLKNANYLPKPALLIPNGPQQKKLVVRHMENHKPLLETYGSWAVSEPEEPVRRIA